MMTTLLRSQTLAAGPNSRLNTPMVPGPQTSCVMSTSAFTHTLSPACTCALPAARARIFSVSVIRSKSLGTYPVPFCVGIVLDCDDVQRINSRESSRLAGHKDLSRNHHHKIRVRHGDTRSIAQAKHEWFGTLVPTF